MPVACLLALGLVCLPSGDGKVSASPGLHASATYTTPTYSIAHTTSDLHRPRDLDQFTALCGSSDCLMAKVEAEPCIIRFEFAEPSDPLKAWTGDAYTVSAQTTAGLIEGLANARVLARKGRDDTLRSLKDIHGNQAIRCPA